MERPTTALWVLRRELFQALDYNQTLIMGFCDKDNAEFVLLCLLGLTGIPFRVTGKQIGWSPEPSWVGREQQASIHSMHFLFFSFFLEMGTEPRAHSMHFCSARIHACTTVPTSAIRLVSPSSMFSIRFLCSNLHPYSNCALDPYS